MPTCSPIAGARGDSGTYDPSSRRRPRSCGAPRRLPSRRHRHDVEILSLRRHQFVRELFVVDVYIDPPARSRAGCDRRAALEHAALASDGADGGSRRPRLGGVSAGGGGAPRRGMARSRALARPEQAACLAGRRLRARGISPGALQALVSAEDARKRWAALAAFYKERGHFLVTNGPYKLKGWSGDSVTLEAFRDLSYPLGVGSYDNYAVPRRGFITRHRAQKDGSALRRHRDHCKSIRAATTSCARRCRRAEVVTRSAPECRYMVTDGEGHVVLAGQVPLAEDASFHVDFGGRLPPGISRCTRRSSSTATR